MELARECLLLGISLLEIQKVEFALYGIVSHLTHLPEGKKFKLQNLSPETFLRGDPRDLKATLGQLAYAFGEKLNLSNNDFTALIRDRNLIAHNYWRMSRTGIREGRKLENPEKFLLEFIEKCQYWKKIINGLLNIFIIAAAEKENRKDEINFDMQQKEEIEAYLKHIKNT